VSGKPYTFDGLPFGPVRPGTTVLVSGPGRVATRLTEELVLAGRNDGEGMLFTSTNAGGGRLVADWVDRYPDLATDRLGVIDATGRGDVTTDTAARMEAVSSPSDLTGISINFSRIYSWFNGRDVTRIRTGMASMSMLLMYTQFGTMTRFVHVMNGRIATTDGLGVLAFDPSMHGQEVGHTFGMLCDGRIEVQRSDGRYELRVDGLDDQPRDWTPIDLG